MSFVRLGILVLFACVVSTYSLAQQVTVQEQIEQTSATDSELSYATPTSMRDTLITKDSIIIIHTVCAPICSSHARVYNKEGDLIRILKAPFQSVFPEAYIEENKVLWRDNDTLDYSPIP